MPDVVVTQHPVRVLALDLARLTDALVLPGSSAAEAVATPPSVSNPTSATIDSIPAFRSITSPFSAAPARTLGPDVDVLELRLACQPSRTTGGLGSDDCVRGHNPPDGAAGATRFASIGAKPRDELADHAALLLALASTAAAVARNNARRAAQHRARGRSTRLAMIPLHAVSRASSVATRNPAASTAGWEPAGRRTRDPPLLGLWLELVNEPFGVAGGVNEDDFGHERYGRCPCRPGLHLGCDTTAATACESFASATWAESDSRTPAWALTISPSAQNATPSP